MGASLIKITRVIANCETMNVSTTLLEYQRQSPTQPMLLSVYIRFQEPLNYSKLIATLEDFSTSVSSGSCMETNLI